MDADRFDTLARSLTCGGSRRRVLSLLPGLTLGALAPLLHRADAQAGKGKKKKKKKKKGTSAPLPVSPPPPPCANGVKDGTETDVDCGGTCRRCGDGKTCAAHNDCVSARCVFTGPGTTCQPCSVNGDCPLDTGGGGCACDTRNDGQKVCNKIVPEGDPVIDCNQCPNGTNCVDFGGLKCFKPCGAA